MDLEICWKHVKTCLSSKIKPTKKREKLNAIMQSNDVGFLMLTITYLHKQENSNS